MKCLLPAWLALSSILLLTTGCLKTAQTGLPETPTGDPRVVATSTGESPALPDRYVMYAETDGDRPRLDRARADLTSRRMQVVKSTGMGRGIVVAGDYRVLKTISDSNRLRLEKDQVIGLVIPRRGRDVQSQKQSTPSGVTQISANNAVARGAGVKVCVVDTGINLSHPDLKENIFDSFSTTTKSSAEDDNGHGTHVAGTIAAIDNTIGVVGVAPKAMIIAAKALNSSGSGYGSDLADAIDGCRTRKAQVINASWGTSSSDKSIAAAVNRALAENIFFIAASGNDGKMKVLFPANIPGVVAVSAVDANENLADFSNYGAEIAHAAPGVDVTSTYLRGAYKVLSGTSMAAPHVSGVAALLLSINPSARPQDLSGIDIGLPLSQQGYGGRIDAGGY